MSANEAASLYGDFSFLWKLYFPEMVSENVEDTIVAVSFFEDVPF